MPIMFLAIALLFSGEESYGRYLDLYANHTQYNNLKHINKRVPYLQYLDVLSASKDGFVHRDIPRATRGLKEYEKCVVKSFSRIMPSLTTHKVTYKAYTPIFYHSPSAHNPSSMSRRSNRWPKQSSKSSGRKVNSQSGMMGMGAIRNKASGALLVSKCRPRECDRTQNVEQAKKMYAKQTVYDAHLKSKKHIKASARAADDGASSSTPTNTNGANGHGASTSRPQSKLHAAARLTALIQPLLVPLLPVVSETKNNVERRFSLTARERELELEAANAPPPPATNAANGNGAAEEEEDEEERIYNPLKLPPGWDGKPIPYWLYKLHGLGVEYRCEICSDAVYMGR